MRKLFLILTLIFTQIGLAQEPTNNIKKDSTQVAESKESPFNTGFYPISFFDVDLRYLIKYNNYEGIRLGFGGITNKKLSDKFRIGGNIARSFKDQKYKYSIGGGIKLTSKNNTWLNLYYKKDIQEVGSFSQLTDKLVYSVFEPRLLNISQFYKHRTWQANIQNKFSSKVISELRWSHSNIEQIINYQYFNNNTLFSKYKVTEVIASVRVSPKTNSFLTEEGTIEYYDGLPNISAQVTQGIKGVFDSNFNYTKFGLKLDYFLKRDNLSSTKILLDGYLAFGDIPLTHLFHAYPNSPTKDEILQRFSVAGNRSFETMYFGEFYSDRLATFQVKHSLRRFYIAKLVQPELVFITKHAIGDLSNKENHYGVTFNTLDHFYSESGIELNKLIFGFGLSFAYRYGFYHLPDFEDNVSFKFTFNLKF
ncbi:MAG: hypothetical protein KUG68_01850 [Flavobacteriaceae bacterium]|nr:hypothetical protein [Flavobacteriaceae bacterium]